MLEAAFLHATDSEQFKVQQRRPCCILMLLGGALSIVPSYEVWDSAAAPTGGNFAAKPKALTLSFSYLPFPPVLLKQPQGLQRGTCRWSLGYPVRDSGMLHADTSPVPSQAMSSAGGAAVSWRGMPVVQYNELQRNRIQ